MGLVIESVWPPKKAEAEGVPSDLSDEVDLFTKKIKEGIIEQRKEYERDFNEYKQELIEALEKICTELGKWSIGKILLSDTFYYVLHTNRYLNYLKYAQLTKKDIEYDIKFNYDESKLVIDELNKYDEKDRCDWVENHKTIQSIIIYFNTTVFHIKKTKEIELKRIEIQKKKDELMEKLKELDDEIDDEPEDLIDPDPDDDDDDDDDDDGDDT